MLGHSANAAAVAVLSKPDNISLLEEVSLLLSSRLALARG